jgi:hypothetical protein
MKSCKIHRPAWAFVLLAGILGTSSGCRSTSSWSPTNWFAGRTPDASTLAGRSGGPDLPDSPASNHTPTALASNALEQQTSGGMQTAQNIMGGATASPSFSNNSGSGYRSPADATGMAARANGYQTGPYGMSSAPSASASLATSSPYGPTTTTASALSSPDAGSSDISPRAGSTPATQASFPSPYGGSYSGYNPASGSSSPYGELPDTFSGIPLLRIQPSKTACHHPA